MDHETNLHNEGDGLVLDDETIYQQLLSIAGGKLTGEPETVIKFENIYKYLHTTASKIGTAYKEVCNEMFGFDPGETQIILGGGRVKGKPLKEDSDLDIFIAVEKLDQSLNLPSIRKKYSGLDALDMRIKAMEEVKKRTSKICEEMDIPNIFHIVQYSSPLFQKENSDEMLLSTTLQKHETQ